MSEQLPIVKYKGKEYYLDETLKQLRAVDNPFDCIQIEDFYIIIVFV